MKRILSIILTLVIVASLGVSALADGPVALTCDLVGMNETRSEPNVLEDGENYVRARTNDIITVTYTLFRTDAATGYKVSGIQNEIKYNDQFFELVPGSIDATVGKGEHQEKISGKRVYFNDYVDASENPKTYNATQVVGTFKLKVKGTTGIGKVENTEFFGYDDARTAMVVTGQDLTVVISPAGLVGVNVSAKGAADGKITGTDLSMEYSTKPDFSDAKPCGDGQTAGLAEGTYYVRYAATTSPVRAASDYVTVAIGAPGAGGGGGGMVAPETFQVTASASSGGTITPNGVQTVKPGSSITFKMTANSGCTLKAVFVDGKDVGAVSEYTFKDVQEAHTIYVSFYDPNGVNYKTCPRDTTCPIEPYKDTKNDFWWHDGIHYCLEKGLMNGFPNGTFQPDGTTTRAQIVTILWRMEGSPKAGYAMSFKDVPAKEWFAEAIRWAQSTGVVTGYNDDFFGPNDKITREQMGAIMYRYAKYKGYDVSKSADLSAYADVGSVSDWAVESMKWANGSGLITGRTAATLAPLGNATRAEVSVIIMRFCEQIAK